MSHFNQGEEKSPTNPIRVRVERFLSMKDSSIPAPIPMPIPATAALPTHQGQRGPISIESILNPEPDAKGKSKASEKGKKSK